MEDKTINFETLSREEILTQLRYLGLIASPKLTTSDLRVKLRNLSKMFHPIHDFIGQMSEEKIKIVYLKIFPLDKKRSIDRMKSSISKEFFTKHPNSPLTALKLYIKTEKIQDIENSQDNMKKSTNEKTVSKETKIPKQKKNMKIQENPEDVVSDLQYDGSSQTNIDQFVGRKF